MRFTKLLTSTASVLLLCGVAFGAGKDQEQDEMLVKPWTLRDIPQLNQTLADVNEVEPNNACPGEAYTLGDIYHASLTAGDQDWVNFSATVGDLITVGTDADPLPGGPSTDTFLELWDNACGAMLTSNDDGGPGLFSLIQDFPAPYTGSYRVKVRGFGATTAGPYRLVANVVTPSACPGHCPVGLYKASKINVEAPIADLGTVCTPTIKFNPQPGCVITDVVIDMNIEHTWAGDLTITLTHTSDGGQVRSVDLVQRPGVPQSTFGCSGDLVSDPEAKYFFGSQQNLGVLGECNCGSVITAGCYGVAPESVDDLSVFNGLPVGDGTFQLCISDAAAGDTGIIHNWSVHLLCEAPVSTPERTWGEVKSLYHSGTE
jgi:subtilisin-like proprotein convertase family protein